MLKSGLLVRASGLLPRKPMSVTLFWYMRVSPFVEFARCCSGHSGRSLASGPGSQVPKVCFPGGARKKFEGVLCRGSQTCFGRNRDPKGAQNAKQKTECRRAPERPRSCDRAKDGIHNGRHAPEQSCHLPVGRGSSQQLQCDSSRHVRHKKGAIRHPSCALKGSYSPTPQDKMTGRKS